MQVTATFPSTNIDGQLYFRLVEGPPAAALRLNADYLTLAVSGNRHDSSQCHDIAWLVN